MEEITDPGHYISETAEKPIYTQKDFLCNGYDYPDWKPFKEGYLDVGDGHEIFYQVAGNPNGIPVVVLHGGPGAGVKKAHGEHFDPNIHKIVLFDQRGAGNSLPYAQTQGNNIANLVSDVSALKKHLGVEEKWNVYGVSWGTTLAMHYATTHPNEAGTLILDATCFGDQPSAKWLVDPSQDWLQEGSEEQRAMKAGAYDEYVNFIKEAKFLGDDEEAKAELNQLSLSEAYYSCLIGDYGENVAVEAATQFMVFDMKLLSPELTDDSSEIQRVRATPKSNLALSRLFYHFYINEYNPEGPDALIDKMVEYWDGKTVMIHGTEDIVTPLEIAKKLQDRMTGAGKNLALYTYGGHGHSKMNNDARVSTRQISERALRPKNLDYEQAVMKRIEALQQAGCEVDVSEEDRWSIDQAASTRMKNDRAGKFVHDFVKQSLPTAQENTGGGGALFQPSGHLSPETDFGLSHE